MWFWAKLWHFVFGGGGSGVVGVNFSHFILIFKAFTRNFWFNFNSQFSILLLYNFPAKFFSPKFRPGTISHGDNDAKREGDGEHESVSEWKEVAKYVHEYSRMLVGWWGGGLAWLEQQPVRALKLVLLYVCLARFALGESLTFPISRMHGTGSRRTTPSIATTSQSYCIILNYIIRS